MNTQVIPVNNLTTNDFFRIRGDRAVLPYENHDVTEVELTSLDYPEHTPWLRLTPSSRNKTLYTCSYYFLDGLVLPVGEHAA